LSIVYFAKPYYFEQRYINVLLFGGGLLAIMFCGFPAGCAGLPFKIISSANEPGENVIVWQFAVLSGIAIFYSIRKFLRIFL